jgi:hypothetical protein
MIRPSSTRTFLRLFMSALVILACAAPALAGQVTWTLSAVTLNDGGSLSGWFVYDSSTNAFTSWSITGQLPPDVAAEMTPQPPHPFTLSSSLSGCEGFLAYAGSDLTAATFDYCPDLALAYRQQGKKSAAKAVMEKLKWLTERKN